MGLLYQWKCSQCSYETTVSGGPDGGFFAFTETVVCTNCEELNGEGFQPFCDEIQLRGDRRRSKPPS